ncbi:hypothetical protein BaRGS_00034089 [Batillaria attramentaria]|uniref:Extracellular membrane protein CFEM domain-containing protein n=1 Tax=Batillaria attramentaria TaxID=370345 RepID=A0ABD0JIA3_9CAEN
MRFRYRYIWKWADGDYVDYSVDVLKAKFAEAPVPPVCAEFSDSAGKYGRLYPVVCTEKNKRTPLPILCETNTSTFLVGKTVHIALQDTLLGNQFAKCPANHSTHNFLLCDKHSACWLDESGDCTAAVTTLPPSFSCADQIERVPYTLVCDYRKDCSDESDETFCAFPDCAFTHSFHCLSGEV